MLLKYKKLMIGQYNCIRTHPHGHITLVLFYFIKTSNFRPRQMVNKELYLYSQPTRLWFTLKLKRMRS